MTIVNPNHRFRLMMKVWTGTHKGEQPFYSAPQKNFLEIIQLVKQIQGGPLHAHVRSYVIHEEILGKNEFSNSTWRELDYSDWSDL